MNFSNFTGNSRFIVNGCDVTDLVNGAVSRESTTRKEEEEDNQYKRRHVLMGSCCLSIITIEGGSIYVKNTALLDHTLLSLVLAGSGDLAITDSTGGEPFKSVNVILTDSGDIDGGFIECANLVIQLTGSGDVDDFFATDSAVVNLTGSGDVHIRVSEKCRVHKTKVGSGDIKVKFAK